MGEHNLAGNGGMVIGDVGVLEPCPVLQFNIETGKKLPSVDRHFFGIHEIENDLRFFGRRIRLLQLCPVPDAYLFAYPKHFCGSDILWQFHKYLLCGGCGLATEELEDT